MQDERYLEIRSNFRVIIISLTDSEQNSLVTFAIDAFMTLMTFIKLKFPKVPIQKWLFLKLQCQETFVSFFESFWTLYFLIKTIISS